MISWRMFRKRAIRQAMPKSCLDCRNIDLREMNIRKTGTVNLERINFNPEFDMVLSPGKDCAPAEGKVSAINRNKARPRMDATTHSNSISFLLRKNGTTIINIRLNNGRYGCSATGWMFNGYPVNGGVFPDNFITRKFPSIKRMTI